MPEIAFQSPYFRLEQVAAGVFAAIATDEDWALGNAGFVDLGDRTVVFDTFASPHAAEDLRRAAEQFTGRAAEWVVNSHWHGDHYFGNQVFKPQAAIIATRNTRQAIEKSVAQFDSFGGRLQEAIRDQHARAAAETDDAKRQGFEKQAKSFEIRRTIYATVVPTVPDFTFDGEFTIQGSRRTAMLLSYSGHTLSDGVMLLPEEGILFAGDLAFIHGHPWMGDGDPDGWLAALDSFATLGVQKLVPGHGPVTSMDAIPPLREYIAGMPQLVHAAIRAGKRAEEIESLPVPEKYRDRDGPEVFGWNTGAFYRRFQEESQG